MNKFLLLTIILFTATTTFSQKSSDIHLLNTYHINSTMSVIHVDNKNKFTLIGTVATKRGARTISLDTKTHLLYLPTADFEPADPTTKGRPKMIPGSFQVMVYGK